MHFYVVIGGANKNAASIMDKQYASNITILNNIKNMPEIMSKCDIAFSSRGRTCFELAYLGIPTISLAQNEREQRHDFACPDNGFSYLGYRPGNDVIRQELVKYLKMNKLDRMKLHQKMLANDLLIGRKNVTNLIEG